MTNNDPSTDQFIREVDEELRREQLTAMWNRFGNYVIAAAVLVVAITAGFKGWEWWQEREAARAGDRYLAAEDLARNDDREAAIEAFNAIAASEGGGYAALAGFRSAALLMEAGDRAGAIAQLDKITSDNRVDDILQDLARLRAAYLALDENDLDGAASRVSPLAVTGNPWRHGAREVLGLVAMETGDNETAIGYFSEIETDQEAPTNIRARATAMIGVLQGETAIPESPPEAGGSAPGAGGGTVPQ